MSAKKGRGRAIVLTAGTIGLAMVIVASARIGHRLGAGRDVLGVRLGMTADEARAALAPGIEGTTSADAMGALEWHAAAPRAGRPDRIRLELHENALAAVRAYWPAGTEAPAALRAVGRETTTTARPLEVWTEGNLVEMLSTDADSGITYTLIDGDCPAHREEASRLRTIR